jgi:hypothetical protein
VAAGPVSPTLPANHHCNIPVKYWRHPTPGQGSRFSCTKFARSWLQHPAPENAAGPASSNLTANDCNIPLRGKECRDKENRTEKWQQDQLCPLVIIATSHSVGLKLRHPRRWKWKNFFAG